MALTFTELLPDFGAQRSTSGITDTSRAFIVPGQTPEDALADPSLNALPPTGAQIGSLHPRNPPGQNLKCSGFRVGERVGAGADAGYRVFAVYRPSGISLGGPGPDVTNLNYKAVAFDTGSVTIQYPSAARILKRVPQLPPLVDFKDTYDYDLTWKDLILPTLGMSITFNLLDLLPANVYTIAELHNTVHTFSGRKWLFTGGTARNMYEDRLWTLEYRWEYEPDTPQTAWSTTLYDPAANGGLGKWVSSDLVEIPARAAFHRWDVTYVTASGPPDPNPNVDFNNLIWPRIITTRVYPEVPNGHTLLPGFSLIQGIM